MVFRTRLFIVVFQTRQAGGGSGLRGCSWPLSPALVIRTVGQWFGVSKPDEGGDRGVGSGLFDLHMRELSQVRRAVQVFESSHLLFLGIRLVLGGAIEVLEIQNIQIKDT